MVPFARLLAYDHWANGESLGSLESSATLAPKAVALMSHVLATEAGGLERLGLRAPFAGFRPEDDLATPRRSWNDDLPARWSRFLADAALSDPARIVAYANTKGERFRSTVADILTHVMLHSAYHRGQIASAVRTAGGVPALTDYIHAARTGRLGGV